MLRRSAASSAEDPGNVLEGRDIADSMEPSHGPGALRRQEGPRRFGTAAPVGAAAPFLWLDLPAASLPRDGSILGSFLGPLRRSHRTLIISHKGFKFAFSIGFDPRLVRCKTPADRLNRLVNEGSRAPPARRWSNPSTALSKSRRARSACGPMRTRPARAPAAWFRRARSPCLPRPIRDAIAGSPVLLSLRRKCRRSCEFAADGPPPANTGPLATGAPARPDRVATCPITPKSAPDSHLPDHPEVSEHPGAGGGWPRTPALRGAGRNATCACALASAAHGHLRVRPGVRGAWPPASARGFHGRSPQPRA